MIKDVSFRVLPINKQDALEMLEGLKGKQILHGFRGSRAVDLEMVAEALQIWYPRNGHGSFL